MQGRVPGKDREATGLSILTYDSLTAAAHYRRYFGKTLVMLRTQGRHVFYFAALLRLLQVQSA
jgi:hypothetical protein